MAASDGVPPDHPIWDVWEALRGFYPGATVNWDSEPPVVWFATLADLQPEQLGNGVRNLVHFCDEDGKRGFPPNAAQFRDLCLNSFDWEHARYKPAAEVLARKPIDYGEGRLLPGPTDNRTPREILDSLKSMF